MGIWSQIDSGAGAVFTLTGNSGGAISPSGSNIDLLTANSNIDFVGSGSQLLLDFSDSTTFSLGLGTSFPNITSATGNIALGNNVGGAITSGSNNIFIGRNTGQTCSTGGQNIVIGNFSFGLASTVTSNTGVGYGIFQSASIGSNNTSLGNSALRNYQGSNATGLGFNSLFACTTGTSNTAVGYNSLNAITTGAYNIAVGLSAGSSLATNDSDNILIGNTGTATDNNAIRIGTQGTGNGQQDKAFVAGISGVTVSNSEPVAIDSNGQLSGLGQGTSGQALVSNGAGSSPTWQAVGGGAWELISTATASNSASISFTDLTSSYFAYVIIINNLQPATDGVEFWMRTSTDNGSTYDSGASDYDNAGIRANPSAINNYGSTDSKINLHAPITDISNVGERRNSWEIMLFNPSGTNFTQLKYNAVVVEDNNVFHYMCGSSQRRSAADVDAIQFLMSSGNISIGTFKLYGIVAA